MSAPGSKLVRSSRCESGPGKGQHGEEARAMPAPSRTMAAPHGLAAILRDASLRDAPQDEGGGLRLRRRDFITLLGGAASAWPLAARAQQPKMPVVGILNIRSPSDDTTLFGAFRRSLQEMGFVEGKNIAIEYRWPQRSSDEYPALMADLVRGGAA